MEKTGPIEIPETVFTDNSPTQDFADTRLDRQ